SWKGSVRSADAHAESAAAARASAATAKRFRNFIAGLLVLDARVADLLELVTVRPSDVVVRGVDEVERQHEVVGAVAVGALAETGEAAREHVVRAEQRLRLGRREHALRLRIAFLQDRVEMLPRQELHP